MSCIVGEVIDKGIFDSCLKHLHLFEAAFGITGFLFVSISGTAFLVGWVIYTFILAKESLFK